MNNAMQNYWNTYWLTQNALSCSKDGQASSIAWAIGILCGLLVVAIVILIMALREDRKQSIFKTEDNSNLPPLGLGVAGTIMKTLSSIKRKGE